MPIWTTALTHLFDDVSLSGVAVGDLFVRGASKWNNLARPALAGNYVLTHDGTGSVPAWANVGSLMLDASQIDSGTIATARLGSGTANSTTFLRGDQTWQTVTSVSGADPTATIGLSATNGVATTFMRSDAAPALSQAITPTWTGQHTFSETTYFANNKNIYIRNTDGASPNTAGIINDSACYLRLFNNRSLGAGHVSIEALVGVIRFVTSNTERIEIANGGTISIRDVPIAFGTSTGTKLGTSTSQKMAFWNASPVVQQVLATGAGATVDNVISLLQTLGLCRQS